MVIQALPYPVDAVDITRRAYTAAEHGANYFANVVNELSANPRMLILHEVMGRDCGWLTAYTAKVAPAPRLRTPPPAMLTPPA